MILIFNGNGAGFFRYKTTERQTVLFPLTPRTIPRSFFVKSREAEYHRNEVKKMDGKELELEVYINGTPDLRLMPKEVAESFFYALEEGLSDWVAQKHKEDSSDESK